MIRMLPLAAALALFAAPAARAQDADPQSSFWLADSGSGPLSIVVSTADQRAYVYRGNALIAATTVSTGKEGKETPEGEFTVLQKAIDHKSNKYDDAPMPFMQRLTWDGLALHAGYNPGHPASHGCVRLPTDFAKRLYAMTKLGTHVTVTDAPVDAGEAAAALVPDAVAAQAKLAAADRDETAKANAAALAASAPN